MTPLQKFVLSMPLVGPLVFRAGARAGIPESLRQQISNKTNKEELINILAPVCVRHSIDRARDISQSIFSFDDEDVERAISGLADINKKIMVICGEYDSFIDIKECKSWWEHWVPNSSFVVIQNGQYRNIHFQKHNVMEFFHYDLKYKYECYKNVKWMIVKCNRQQRVTKR